MASGVAFFVALFELVTSKYARTFFFCRKSVALYSYSLVYGAIGFGVALGINSLIENETITLEGPGVENLWVQAAVVGLAIKALLHIRVFTVGTGPQTFPIGAETIVQVFEPWLLRTIELDHFNQGREFIEPRAEKHSDLSEVKKQIKENVPRSFSQQERTAFEADVDKMVRVVDAMELCIEVLGRRTFNRVFPK